MRIRSLLLCLIALAVASTCKAELKYVFVIIGDGYGQNQRLITETLIGKKLYMSQMPVKAINSTNNVYGLLTDSAASGTALATGTKTFNGAIGVDFQQQPLTSISRKLANRGFKIAIISSSHLTDATPGAHYAHQPNRGMVDNIGAELAASGYDFFGGAEVKGKKTLELMRQNGYQLLDGFGSFDKITQKSKIYVHNQPYTTWNIDSPEPPLGYTLAQYAQKAIDLYQDNPQGFFMMIENGHTDYAGHNNDSGKMVREVLALDALVKTALDFQAKHPEETLVIVSADHETGGLKLTNDHLGNVDLLKAQKMELSVLDTKIRQMITSNAAPEKIYDFIIDSIGYTTPSKPVADKLMERIKRALKATAEGKNNQTVKFVELVKERDRSIGFEYTTGGHSTAQVITNAQGVGAEKFAEIVENCDIPVLIEYLITNGGNLDDYQAFRERVTLAKRLNAAQKDTTSSDAVKVEFVPAKTIITEIAGKKYTAGIPDFSKIVSVNVSAGKDYYLIELHNQTSNQSAMFNLVLNPKVNNQNIDLIDLKADLRLLPAFGGSWTRESLANNLRYVLAPAERAILLLSTSKNSKLPLNAKNVTTQTSYEELYGESQNLNLLELHAAAGEPINADKILLKDSNGISGQDDLGSVKAFIDTRDNSLALSITLPDTDLICQNTDPEKRDTPVYDDDCVEILFGDIGTKNFYHIIINPALAIYDANTGETSWSAELKDMQVSKEDKSWTLKVKIPLAQFKFSNFPTWNICYMNKPSGKIYNLFPVGQSGFQSPEKMAPLLVKYDKKNIFTDRLTENQ